MGRISARTGGGLVMVLRTIHAMLGDSTKVGQGARSDLTNLTWDISDSAVQIVRRNGGGALEAASTMVMGANSISIEHPIGHGRKAAGESNPFIFTRGLSSSLLRINWRPYIVSGTYANFVADLRGTIEGLEAAGDTVELRSLSVMLGVNDAQVYAADFAEELVRFVPLFRGEFGEVPIFWGKPASDITTDEVTSSEIAQVRAGIDAAEVLYPRFYGIEQGEEDGITVPLRDEVHPTPDGSMIIGERFLAAMASDGVATNGLADLTGSARFFPSLADAQVYAAGCQAQHGDRSEDPAAGGLGERLGADCVDPWPVTPYANSAEKHPHRDEWCVPVTSTISAGPIRSDVDLRPIRFGFYEPTAVNAQAVLVDGGGLPVLDGNGDPQPA